MIKQAPRWSSTQVETLLMTAVERGQERVVENVAAEPT